MGLAGLGRDGAWLGGLGRGGGRGTEDGLSVVCVTLLSGARHRYNAVTCAAACATSRLGEIDGRVSPTRAAVTQHLRLAVWRGGGRRSPGDKLEARVLNILLLYARSEAPQAYETHDMFCFIWRP